MRRFIPLLSLLLLMACGGVNGPSSPLVTYKVDGTAARADMTYQVAGGSTQQSANAALPWQWSFVPNSPSDFLYISAQNAGSTGCVHVAIYQGNSTTPLREAQSCGAFVIATASK